MLKRTPGKHATVLPRPVGGRDVRTATTMWGLLVWAYKRELVRYCEGRVADDRRMRGGSTTASTCRMLQMGIIAAGPVARVTRVPVHADAEWVHGLVSKLDRDEFWLIVRSAEAGTAPEWDPAIPEFRVVPMLKANGRPRMLVCPVERRPIACRIMLEGVPPHEAEAIRRDARERYRSWVRLLMALRDRLLEEDALSRWRVTGIGVDFEPWGAHVAAGC